MRDAAAAGRALLAWYDLHARVLPWRTGPAERAAGARPDPYRVWLSEVMLQQTTVAAVRERYARFLARWPDVAALAAAPEAEVMAEWAGLGYYARARNLVACARAVAAAGGFPDTEAGLRALPGIGPYTAAAIAAIAFDRAATVVDANVERVVARLYAVNTPLPAAKREIVALAEGLAPRLRSGDHAQAMMDLGAGICTPRRPACALCPLAADCAAALAGDPEAFPKKAGKPAKPRREGRLWIARRDDGAWLMETRPPRGMLGGMLGWPGTPWDGRDGAGSGEPPIAARWRQAAVGVRHGFTHFDLDLEIAVAEVGPDLTPARGVFVPRAGFSPAALPTVMRKAHAVALAALAAGEPA